MEKAYSFEDLENVVSAGKDIPQKKTAPVENTNADALETLFKQADPSINFITLENSEPVFASQLAEIQEQTSEPAQENEISDKPGIQDFDYSSMIVEDVVDVSELQPWVVYVKFKDMDQPVGIPGFFDKSNIMFIPMDGNVSPFGFENAFNKFLLRKIEAEKGV